MKNRTTITLLSILFFTNFLIAEEKTRKQPRFEWVDGNEVAVCEDGIYIESNMGMARLDVVEYDEKTDRYLVDNLNWWRAFNPTQENHSEQALNEGLDSKP